MKAGLQIPSFTWPGGPEAIGPTLARVARSASHALTNAALPFLLEIGAQGVEAALEADPALKRGLQVYQGKIQE